MDLTGRIRSCLGVAALLGCAALIAAVPAAVAADQAPAPEEATAKADSLPEASLEFTRRTASLVGSRALVYVRCEGESGEPCVGTLALRGGAGSHKTPYSIECDEEQIVVVPLGADERALGRLKSVRAVARTLQPSGASVATAKRLRIRE
jgi:hypothetical protein